jgi:3-oxoacyl-[acyl-carrier-protein] synthase II
LNEIAVVSALGTAGAFGCGSRSLAQALAAGVQPASTEVDRSGGFHRPAGARRALLMELGALAPWLPAAMARRMSPPSRLAVAAARMALAESGLAPEAVAGPRTAVVLATTFGPSSCSEALLRQILLEGPQAASPYLFTESVANAAAAQIAIACGARGTNLTLCQREAGALLALGYAAAEVAAGRADVVLAGAVDEIAPVTHALLDRFGALARQRGVDGCDEVGRPFDRGRNGVVAAEGATVLVVESAAAVRRRGHRPLARIRGWGSAFDPAAPPSGWGRRPELLGRALRRFLARAAVAADEPAGGAADQPAAAAGIDRIVSGAAGARAGDRLEALVLRAAWGPLPLPPVLVPKGVTGEYGGGFLAAAVLAAAGAPHAAAAGFAEPDPELQLVPHDGRPLPPPDRLLVSSLAAGGGAAWLLLGQA